MLVEVIKFMPTELTDTAGGSTGEFTWNINTGFSGLMINQFFGNTSISSYLAGAYISTFNGETYLFREGTIKTSLTLADSSNWQRYNALTGEVIMP